MCPGQLSISDPYFLRDTEVAVTHFGMLRGALGAILGRSRICRANHPYVPTRIVPREEPGRLSYPHLLSAVMLANSAQGAQARARAFSPAAVNPVTPH